MRRRLLALPVLLALTVAGCGESDDDSAIATANGSGTNASASASAPAMSDSDRQLKFAQCMRENGVDMPDPDTNGGQALGMGGKMDSEQRQVATEKCRDWMPNGGAGQRSDPEHADQTRELAKCMRESGVPDFPDPDADGKIPWDSAGIDRDDPKVQETLEKCQQYSPQTGGGNR